MRKARSEPRRSAGDFDPVEESYEYDGLNRMTLARDEDSEVRVRYDSLSRVTGEIR